MKDKKMMLYNLIREFVKITDDYKAQQTKYNSLKKLLTEKLLDAFDENGVKKSCIVDIDKFEDDSSINELKIKIIKQQNVSIDFDCDKLENVLGKDLRKKIILKKYVINDIIGLTSYLKSCGVNPSKFKSFLSIEKSIDKNAIDYFEARGMLDAEEIKGCYTVSKGEPYFKVYKMKNEEENFD